MNNNQKIQIYFNKLDTKMTTHVPVIVSETAFKNFQNNFFTESFDNIKWLPAKKQLDKKDDNERKTLLRKSGILFGSLTQKLTSPNRVIISAGGSQIPYARIHNEGGVIERRPRTETFQRNKEILPSGMWKFKKGTSKGRGFAFKAYKITIPKRQYMGVTNALKTQIRNNILAKLNEK